MKLIVAVISPEHRSAVLESIDELDACVVSLDHVTDGGTSGVPGIYRGTDTRSHSPRLRLEVAVADSVVDDVVDSIIVAAGRGSSTDLRTCHVFVLPVEEWVRFPDLEPSQRSSKGEDRIRSHRGGVFHVTP